MSYNRNYERSEPERSIKGPMIRAPDDLMRKDHLIKALYPVEQRSRPPRATSSTCRRTSSSSRRQTPSSLRSENEFIDYVNLNTGVLAGLTTSMPVADRVNAAIVNDHLATVYLSSTEQFSQGLTAVINMRPQVADLRARPGRHHHRLTFRRGDPHRHRDYQREQVDGDLRPGSVPLRKGNHHGTRLQDLRHGRADPDVGPVPQAGLHADHADGAVAVRPAHAAQRHALHARALVPARPVPPADQFTTPAQRERFTDDLGKYNAAPHFQPRNRPRPPPLPSRAAIKMQALAAANNNGAAAQKFKFKKLPSTGKDKDEPRPSAPLLQLLKQGRTHGAYVLKADRLRSSPSCRRRSRRSLSWS